MKKFLAKTKKKAKEIREEKREGERERVHKERENTKGEKNWVASIRREEILKIL